MSNKHRPNDEQEISMSPHDADTTQNPTNDLTGAPCAGGGTGDGTGNTGHASPTPSFDELVGLGVWWLAENKPHYSMCEGLPIASSAASAVFAAPDDVSKAIEIALADPDEVFGGSLDDDEIRDLICAIHPAHKAADIPYQTAP
jgi:hypothetical protein